MRILFCAYRDWATRIVATFESTLIGHHVTIAQTPQDMERTARESQWDVVVLIGWSWKVPADICNSRLVIGMHPSDLPYFAGGSPIQNQIIRGLSASKATLFRLNEHFDRGEIIDKEEFSLEGHIDEVFDSIGRATYLLIDRFIRNFPENQYTPQPVGEGSVFRRLRPSESRLNCVMPRREESNGDSAERPLTCRELWDFIRCREDPYPNAYLEDDTGRLVIKRVEFYRKG
jgi:methionyl-tRNA formyltransferase